MPSAPGAPTRATWPRGSPGRACVPRSTPTSPASGASRESRSSTGSTGGEVADWGDSKIDTEGTHPVVYAAAGSHASYWWRTFGCSTLLAGIAIATGPLVGIAMIFFTSLPLSLVNVFGSIIFALAVPWLVIAGFLLYLDLEERSPAAPPPGGDCARRGHRPPPFAG